LEKLQQEDTKELGEATDPEKEGTPPAAVPKVKKSEVELSSLLRVGNYRW